MKKLLVVLLSLILCVSMLSSCNFLKNFAEIRGEQNKEETPAEYNVDAAAEYIYNLYKNKSTTATDFEVTAKVSIAGVLHDVEWSVDTDKVTIVKKDANTYIINVDEESPEELAYVLTATVKGGDKTATKSFNLTVPKYVLTPFEEYINMTEGDVVVKGIVVAINSKAAGNTRNHLFLADLEGKGGYYSYQMDADPVADLGIKVGMIVEVAGPVSPYSGMQEIKGGVARIVDPTIHTFETVDITEIFASGGSLKNYVGLLVTVKGVEIIGQELGGTSEYLKFKLNGKEAYIRTYVTDFPTSLKVEDKATIDAAHAEHFGWTANATGVLVLYNSNPYLIPVGVDCFEYLELIVKSDEEKIADVLDQIKLGTAFSSDTVVELPTAVYPEVVLSWTSNNEAVVIADGKLTITVPDEVTEVLVTLTAQCGDKTATKEFTLKLSKTAESVKDIIDLGASMEHNQYTTEKHLVAGVITEVYNTQYGNMKITDEFGNILTIYGTYSADGSTRYDAMESKPEAGDYVVIFGIVGQYNGTPQIKNGWIRSFTKPTSVKDAIDTGASMEHNTYTEDKVVVTGVITEVYNTKYGNMKITDENGNILTIYGTYSSTGANRYDVMEGAPVAGDTVTIYGILGQYSGTPQIKNGWIVAVTKGSDTPECTEHVDADGDEKCDNCGADVPAVQPPVEDPAADSTLTIEQVLALGASKEHDTYTEGKYYVTGVITEVYNAQYGNMRITDEAGNILTIYGTYSADGTVRYDALEVKPVAGDTVTIYGIVGQYKGTPQIKNGWIVKHTPVETPENPPVEDDGLKLDLWMSNSDLFTVNGLNIKYNGAGNTYACVGSNVADLAAGNNTFTVTVTNNGAADARVRFDLQGSVQVGNHKVCNVSAVGGDVWTDMEWGGSVVTVPAGQSVTLVITYDENTERGAVVDLIIFVDGARGDANTYSADITLSGMAFSKVENEAPDTPDVPAEGTTVTGVIADIAKANGWAKGTRVESFNLNDDIIVSVYATPVGSYGLNSGKPYGDPVDNWRIYQNENPEIVIKAVEGKTIVSVKITYTLDKTGILTLDGKNVESDTVITVNANSITFSVGNTGTVTNGQVRITAIEVVYAGGNDTPVEPEECKHTNTVVEGAIEATCDKAGFTGNTVCADCKEVITNGEEIPATGKHTFEEGKCTVCGAEDPNYTPETPATEWTLTTELKDGDRVLIGAPAYGKLLSTTKTGFYNVGIDYSADNFANVTDAEIFVVTVNADGSYTFTSLTGDVIALADSYSSLNADGAHKSWTLKANGDGTFLVYNTGRKTYLEWYASKNNWSTYTAGNTAEYYLSFYAQKAASGDTPVEPECKHTNTVVEGATEATCDKAGFTGNTVCADCKEVITKGEEIPATGKHTFDAGKCTVCGAEDPDYVKPDAPVAGGSADFNSIEGKGSSSYASATTANGWVISNSAIQAGGTTDMNPQYIVVGPDSSYKAVCMNGKVSAPGQITSPTLTGGISQLTIKYTKIFTDTTLSVTVTITDANGNKISHVIEVTLEKSEKYVVYTDVWTLDTPITGDFTIELVNNCPTGSTSNKDRITILDISWN